MSLQFTMHPDHSMATGTAPDSLPVLGLFRGIAELLTQNATGSGGYDAANGFYIHLQARLMLVSVQVARVKPETFAASNLSGLLLSRFESLISEDVLSRAPASAPAVYPPRIHALLEHWDGGTETKLEICKTYVDFGGSRRDELLSFLKGFEDQVTARFPENSPEPTGDYQPPRSKRQEPSEAIWAAAQSLFDAIHATKCPDHHDHEFGARLGLGTYRGCQVGECSTFDMFLALEQVWQEVHVKAFAKVPETAAERQSKVKFDDGQEAKVLPKRPKAKRAPVSRLCEAMEKARAFPTYRLQLAVENGRLFNMTPERSKLGIDKTKPPVSLESFLTERPHSLREKTKRILAVFLAYAVFHLQGTQWLECGWGSGSIVFFETASGIPLKPYIQLPLMEPYSAPPLLGQTEDAQAAKGEEEEEEEEDDFDPYNFLSHPFPNLVTLAAMLIELHMARPIASLADDYGLREMYSHSGENSLFLLTLEIFDKCKLEISEQTRAAIDRCLDRNIGLRDDGTDLDRRELRRLIYADVVQPLEDELHQGFQYIAIDELDEMAHTFDLGRWGRVIQTQSRESSRPGPPAATARNEALMAAAQASTQLSWTATRQRGRSPSPVAVCRPVRRPRAISPSGESSLLETRTVEAWVSESTPGDWDP